MADGKSKGGRPKGSKGDKSLRGNQRKDRHEKVLGPQDDETIIDELRRFAPMCTIAAKLNVARHTLARYIHGKPELQKELDDSVESQIDMTQRAMFDAAIGNVARDKTGRPVPVNVNAGAFLLDRLGRQRGFGQHIEIDPAKVPTFTFSRRDSKVKAERGG